MKNNKQINSKKCAIALLARDCENNLKKNIKEVEKLIPLFETCDIVVIENDSIDNTKQILNEWNRNNKNVVVISMDNIFSSSDKTGAGLSRIERMCFYRNKYMEYFKQQNKNYDYLIVVDADLDYFSSSGIIKAIKNSQFEWEALFANGRFYSKICGLHFLGKYYDNYAYVPYKSDTIHLDDWQMKQNNDYISFILNIKKYVHCQSAFGGLAIYKYEKVRDFIYNTIQNEKSKNNKVLCEHIVFNNKLDKSKLYIAKNIKVLYQKQPLFIYIKSILNIQTIQVLFYKLINKKHFF